ncbi:DUF1097 domain-containing protein [Shigella flexneri]
MYHHVSGVYWALGDYLWQRARTALEIVSYVMTGIVAFLTRIQANSCRLPSYQAIFTGACATFAGQGDWKLVLPSLALGLVFGYAMKNSGLWLAARSAKTAHREQEIKNKA